MTPDDILLEAEEKMIKTEQVVVNEFAGVRTGKASAALVENIIVEVYGSQMRIRELAASPHRSRDNWSSSRGTQTRRIRSRRRFKRPTSA